MSTKAQLRLDTYRAINEDDPEDPTNTTPTNTHFSASEIDRYVQQAITLLGTEMEWAFKVSQAASVLDQALYQLPDDFIEATEVYFDGKALMVVDRGDLSAISTEWQTHPSGLPKYAYKADNDVIGIYPPPSSEYAGRTIQIQYIAVPATLSNEADVPDLHAAFQMCLPFYAAFLCESKLGNDKKAATNLSLYETHRKKLMSKVQAWSPDLMRFRWSWNYQ